MLKEKLAAQFDFLKSESAAPSSDATSASSSVKLVEIAEAGP